MYAMYRIFCVFRWVARGPSMKIDEHDKFAVLTRNRVMCVCVCVYVLDVE
jgi:hypothetical protein